MISEFALDLKVARRKAGLRQRDSAHLLGVDQSKVSQFELGRKLPNVHEFCTLCVVYGASSEGLLATFVCDVRRVLPARLATIPECQTRTPGTFNRQQTLNRLAEALADQRPAHEA